MVFAGCVLAGVYGAYDNPPRGLAISLLVVFAAIVALAVRAARERRD
ncbi:MAG: hypothetical protein QOC54_51 [Baekduia sp.]|nr:hypothetical protein [Baekduia sp.]